MVNQVKNYRKSKHVREELLHGENYTTPRGARTNRFVYDVKASQVTDEEIKRMAKLANDRLYKLEKSGQDEYSREYQLVQHYAVGDPNGRGSIYNVSDDQERIRFTSSARGMSSEERAYLVNTIRNFLRAETSTVTGTRKAAKKALASYKASHKNAPDMDYKQYQKMWKIYREEVLQDKDSHESYNAFISIMNQTNLYNLSEDQMREAMNYLKTTEESSVVGILDSMKEKTEGKLLTWV